jgi:hypothetical protein
MQEPVPPVSDSEKRPPVVHVGTPSAESFATAVAGDAVVVCVRPEDSAESPAVERRLVGAGCRVIHCPFSERDDDLLLLTVEEVVRWMGGDPQVRLDPGTAADAATRIAEIVRTAGGARAGAPRGPRPA